MMATIDKDLLLDKIDRLLKLHNYAREDWFANAIHNTVWDVPEIETDGDLISRADAIDAVRKELVCDGRHETHDKTCRFIADVLLSALPSADITETEECQKCQETTERVLLNKASAEAVQGWIPFTRRPMTEEEQKDYPNCTFMFDCVLPDDGDEILVSNGRFVWMDTFCNDIDGCYLDSGDDIGEDMAWMPLPKPYRECGEV